MLVTMRAAFPFVVLLAACGARSSLPLGAELSSSGAGGVGPSSATLLCKNRFCLQ